MMSCWFGGALWGALLACGVPEAVTDEVRDTDTTTDDATDTGAVCTLGCEVGLPDDPLAAMPALHPVVLVHGPQGGWHIDGGARIHDAPGPTLDVRFRAYADGVSLGSAVGSGGLTALTAAGECAAHTGSHRIYLDEIGLEAVCGLEGEVIDIEVSFRHGQSDWQTCTQQAVGVLDPIDVDPCAAL